MNTARAPGLIQLNFSTSNIKLTDWFHLNLKTEKASFTGESEDKKKCIKIIYSLTNEQFIGINSFGIRLRHEVFDRWLREGRKTDYVLEHLNDSLFDPEFYKNEIPSIISAYNEQFKKEIKGEKFNWNRILS